MYMYEGVRVLVVAGPCNCLASLWKLCPSVHFTSVKSAPFFDSNDDGLIISCSSLARLYIYMRRVELMRASEAAAICTYGDRLEPA